MALILLWVAFHTSLALAETTDTEVMITSTLPNDDDCLHADSSCALQALQRHGSLGTVQTAADEISSTSCPSQCERCRAGGGDGGVELVDGKCTHHCSSFGFCGTSAAYKFQGSVDCTSCGAVLVPSRRCDSKCYSPHCRDGGSGDGGIPLQKGVCTSYCSVFRHCGTSNMYSWRGTDCTACRFEVWR